MFLGTFTPRLDDKNRLILPAKWRPSFDGGIVMTRGQERCVFAFPRAAFEHARRRARRGAAHQQGRPRLLPHAAGRRAGRGPGQAGPRHRRAAAARVRRPQPASSRSSASAAAWRSGTPRPGRTCRPPASRPSPSAPPRSSRACCEHRRGPARTPRPTGGVSRRRGRPGAPSPVPGRTSAARDPTGRSARQPHARPDATPARPPVRMTEDLEGAPGDPGDLVDRVVRRLRLARARHARPLRRPAAARAAARGRRRRRRHPRPRRAHRRAARARARRPRGRRGPRPRRPGRGRAPPGRASATASSPSAPSTTTSTTSSTRPAWTQVDGVLLDLGRLLHAARPGRARLLLRPRHPARHADGRRGHDRRRRPQHLRHPRAGPDHALAQRREVRRPDRQGRRRRPRAGAVHHERPARRARLRRGPGRGPAHRRAPGQAAVPGAAHRGQRRDRRPGAGPARLAGGPGPRRGDGRPVVPLGRGPAGQAGLRRRHHGRRPRTACPSSPSPRPTSCWSAAPSRPPTPRSTRTRAPPP